MASGKSSPFQARDSDNGEAADEDVEYLEFTLENVDRTIDEVRPYMVADGGNCRVTAVDVATGEVRLVLEGACGSCPSSTETLRFGVERVLRDKFGPRFSKVVAEDESASAAAAVAAAVAGAGSRLSLETVEAMLRPLRPALQGLGAIVKVREVDADAGRVRVEYKGPPKLAHGVEMTLRESSLVREVLFV